MANIDHEREVVVDVVRTVCSGWGLVVHNVEYPEDWRPQPERPLDALVLTSGASIAVEHTLHQSFPEQIGQIRWYQGVMELASRMSGTLPRPGRYELSVSSDALRGQQRANLDSIERWIRETAPTLTAGRTLWGPTNVANATPPEVPFPVQLLRTEHWEGVPSGDLSVRWPFDMTVLPLLSVEEMERALRKKLPKLEEHRPLGGITLLVLENQDIQLVNIDNVAGSIRAALAAAPELPIPDAIVMVNVCGAPIGLQWLKDHDVWH